MSLYIVECKCKENFRKSDEYLIADDQLRQHNIRDWVSEGKISGVRDANKSTINSRRSELLRIGQGSINRVLENQSNI